MHLRHSFFLVDIIKATAPRHFFLRLSLEREEAEDLIKQHGGRVTATVTNKTVKFFFLDVFEAFCCHLRAIDMALCTEFSSL